ncbi:MAG: histidine kinase [Bacteroidetes bacterium]|nr:histidine kinase [Bacteroidota bacterium]
MAYELLQKFKELMLLSLAMDNKKEVTLEEEIKFLSTYLELEQSRLNGRLDFLIKADDNVSLQRKIPAMLLLPYVLEAVERSLQPITEPGRIWIVFKISGMSLQVIIDDNGLSRNCAVPGFEIDNRISFYPGEKTGNRVALSL